MVRIDTQPPGIDLFLDEGDPFMSAFNALFIIVPIIFVGIVVLVIVLAVVNARRLRSKGISPLATEAEIEQLHATGKITTAEPDAARASVLRTL